MGNINFYIEQFKTEIYDIYKAYRFSHFGLYHLRNVYLANKEQNNIESLRIKDPQFNIDLRFNEDDVEQAREDGFYQKIMAGNTIAMIYNLWEDKYRSIFAKINGLNSKKAVQNDFFGDLNLIRQSITHNHFNRTSAIDRLKVLGSLFPNNEYELNSTTIEVIYIEALSMLDNLKTS